MFDFLKPKILEIRQSDYSGELKVVSGFGYKYITTGPLTQTGGIVKDVWEPVLKKYGIKGKSWLILGLAGGTIAQIISKRFHPKKIVGVEIDPIMIDLGKKYLDLDKIPDLEIVVQDAQKYILDLDLHFDFTLVDMYCGDQLPSFVYSPNFLKKLKLLSSYVIFNHLFYDAVKKQKAEELVGQLKLLFPRVCLSRQLTNLFIICD